MAQSRDRTDELSVPGERSNTGRCSRCALRLKEKIQKKQLAKDVSPTTSLTYETSLLRWRHCPECGFLTGELRAAKVELTPSLAYNSNTTIWGGFLSVGWQHNCSDDFNTEAGIAAGKPMA